MNELVRLIASEMESSGGTSIVPFVLIGGGVVAAVLIQRSRMTKARARVIVRRVPDDGHVEFAGPPDLALAVGVRAIPDAVGTVTLLEAAP